jgi:hypothetical protein
VFSHFYSHRVFCWLVCTCNVPWFWFTLSSSVLQSLSKPTFLLIYFIVLTRYLKFVGKSAFLFLQRMQDMGVVSFYLKWTPPTTYYSNLEGWFLSVHASSTVGNKNEFVPIGAIHHLEELCWKLLDALSVWVSSPFTKKIWRETASLFHSYCAVPLIILSISIFW